MATDKNLKKFDEENDFWLDITDVKMYALHSCHCEDSSIQLLCFETLHSILTIASLFFLLVLTFLAVGKRLARVNFQLYTLANILVILWL